MILQNIPRVIMMIMFISTARPIIFRTLQIMLFSNRSVKASIFIFLREVGTMKTLRQAAGLRNNYMIKGSCTNWISGVQNGHTIGIRGEKCCHITWEQDFKLYMNGNQSFVFLNYFK